MIIARKKKMAIIWRLKPDILLVIHQSLIFDIVSPKVSSVWQYDIQHRTRHGPAFRIPKSLYFQLSSGLSTVASYYYKWWHLIACCAGVSLMGGLISGYGRARGVIRLSVAVTSTYTQASFIIHPVSGVINRYIYLLYYWKHHPFLSFFCQILRIAIYNLRVSLLSFSNTFFLFSFQI